ncbi:MAG: hypothetical protein RLP14_04935 [Owenweeksia sp.]
MRKIAILTLLIVWSSSCKLRRKLALSITRSVSNSFTESSPDTGKSAAYPFKERDFFVMRTVEVPVVKIPVGNDTVLNEVPFRSFQVLQQEPLAEQTVIDEVYIYLNQFSEKSVTSGLLLFMSNTPLLEITSKNYFNNPDFISTVPIRDVRTGTWFKTVDDSVTLSMIFEEKEILIKGHYENEVLVLTKVSHPKLNTSSYLANHTILIDIKEVFGLQGAEGLSFIRNTANRQFIYPDWNKNGKFFVSDEAIPAHLNYLPYRCVDSLYIEDQGKGKPKVHFQFSDVAAKSSQEKNEGVKPVRKFFTYKHQK